MELLSGTNLAALLTLPGVGEKRALAIAARFQNWDSFLTATRDDLIETLGPRTGETLAASLPSHPLQPPLPNGVQVVSVHEPHYPQRLRELHDAPLLLWWMGTLPNDDLPLLAVVGTRTPNQFGAQVAAAASARAAHHQIPTVSGLAVGVDSVAHRESLKAGLPTWALLGQGISTLPQSGDRSVLARRIVESGGGLISEVPPGTPVAAHLLTRRNRLQAAFSRAVFIAQSGLPGAAKPAGTMHTARYAIEQRRPLAVAVPPPTLINDETLAGNTALSNQDGIDPNHLRVEDPALWEYIAARRPAADLCVAGLGDLDELCLRVRDSV